MSKARHILGNPTPNPTPPTQKRPSSHTSNHSNARKLFNTNRSDRSKNPNLLSHRHTAVEELFNMAGSRSGDGDEHAAEEGGNEEMGEGGGARRPSYFNPLGGGGGGGGEKEGAGAQLSAGGRRGSMNRADSVSSVRSSNNGMGDRQRKRSTISDQSKKSLMNRSGVMDESIINTRAERELAKVLNVIGGRNVTEDGEVCGGDNNNDTDEVGAETTLRKSNKKNNDDDDGNNNSNNNNNNNDNSNTSDSNPNDAASPKSILGLEDRRAHRLSRDARANPQMNHSLVSTSSSEDANLQTLRNNRTGGGNLHLPPYKMQQLMSHLQDNSSEDAISQTLLEICYHTASIIGCEKVDLLLFDVIGNVLTPMCQYVNVNSEMYKNLSLGGDDVPTNEFLTQLLAPHSIPVKKNSMWSDMLGELRVPSVCVDSSEDVKERLGGYYETVAEWLPERAAEIDNFLAVPVRCTRGVSHCVAIMLCMNKMVDVEGSPMGKNTSRPEFEKLDDTIFANQLSQFAGIAIANLELMMEVGSKQNRLNSLVKIITELSSEKSGEMLKHLFEDAQALLSAEIITMYTVNDTRSDLKLAFYDGAALHSESPTFPPTIKIDQNSLAGIVAWTGHTMCLSKSTSKKSGNDFAVDYKQLLGNNHSILCTPVIYSDKTDAVIIATNRQSTNEFSLDDIDLLTILGKATGVLLHQTNTIKDKMSAARLADVSGRLIKMVSNPHHSVHFIIEEVCKDAILLVPAVTASLYFVDQGNDEIWTFHPTNKNRIIKLPIGVGLAGYCVRSRETLNVEDAYKSQTFISSFDSETDFKTKSCVNIPILHCVEEHSPSKHRHRSAARRRSSAMQNRRVSRSATGEGGGYEGYGGRRGSAMAGRRGSIPNAKNDPLRELTRLAVDEITDEKASSRRRESALGSILSGEALHESERRGPVVAVLQVINKKNMKGEVIPFSDDDVVMLENYARKVEDVFMGKMVHFQHLKLTVDAIESGEQNKLLSLESGYHNKESVYDSHGHHAFRKYSDMMRAKKEAEIVATELERRQLVGRGEEMVVEGEGNEQARKGESVVDLLKRLSITDRVGPNGKVADQDIQSDDYRHFSHWEHNVLNYSLEDAEKFVYLVWDQFGFLNEFNTDQGVCKAFIFGALGKYRETSYYHNYRHGIQVLHAASCLLLEGPDLNDIVAWGVLIAALCHDIDHPGHTNNLEIASNTELSRLYSDDSVLERHHSATTLNLLNRAEMNILEGLETSDYKEIRNVIIKAILCTDMSSHAKLLEDLEMRLPGCFDEVDEEDSSADLVASYIDVIMHTADLSSNSVPSFHKWGMLIAAEFRKQAEKEEALGVAVTPFMKDIGDGVSIAKVQFGFTFYVVLPWFEAVEAAEIFDFEGKVDKLHDVIDFYDNKRKEGGEGGGAGGGGR